MVWGEELGVIVVVGLIGKVTARVGKLGYWLIGVDLLDYEIKINQIFILVAHISSSNCLFKSIFSYS